jgi:hypothetical protein
MRLLLLAFLAVVLEQPALAQTPNDLNDKAVFERDWSGLIDKMGTNLDVAEVVIRPEAIEVQARAEAGGARIDRWRVGRTPSTPSLRPDPMSPKSTSRGRALP